METYEKMVLEVVFFENNDVITDSRTETPEL